ncbi:hypothetical protein [Acanthamoeba polyphaga mimivirus]|uniref:Uncharacterized protein n=1 Tax=Acanthamoeba polyphaga mimivirus TaxID=212035 RepID=A0A0G2Y512_MIMIV|nr:hypothetical protein [Acanthamoeba polyphaga mimivirus]
MNMLTTIKFQNDNYYFANDITDLKLTHLPRYNNGRELIRDKGIKEPDFTYVKKSGNKWIEADGVSCRYDKPIIKVDYAKENLLIENKIVKKVSKKPLIKTKSKKVVVKEDSESDDVEPEIVDGMKQEYGPDGKRIGLAPGILVLKKKEMFKNADKEVLEIEVRGTRRYDNIFFSVNDLSVGFHVDRLRATVLSKNSSYVYGLHFRYFMIEIIDKNVDERKKSKKVKEPKISYRKKMFLTYIGLHHMFHTTKGAAFDIDFIGWIHKNLFKVHLGTDEQKLKLASNLMGLSVNEVKAVFTKTSSAFPAIYLYTIGKVKDLRASFNLGPEYDDDDFIGKAGKTDNIYRRTMEHDETYGKIPGANLHLKWYVFVMPFNLQKAETEILNMFRMTNKILTHPKHNELVIIPKEKKDQKYIIDQYDCISAKYAGIAKGLTEEIEKLNDKIERIEMKHSNDIDKIEMKHSNEIEKFDKENKLLKKDINLFEYKLEQKDREIRRLKKLADYNSDESEVEEKSKKLLSGFKTSGSSIQSKKSAGSKSKKSTGSKSSKSKRSK